MNRLILATILITVVYSWEDFKQTLVFLVKSIARQKYNPTAANHLDEFVGAALILATLPVNLVILLVAEGSLLAKLLVILSEFLLIGLIAEVTELISRKLAHQHYANVWALMSSFAVGLVSPAFRTLGQITSRPNFFARYLKHLAFPLFFGLILKVLVDKFGSDLVSAQSNPLIIVVVAGLMLNATIDILEKFFHSNPLHMFSYFRIALGVVIVFLLTTHLI